MIEINQALFITICVFAGIGALVVAFFLIMFMSLFIGVVADFIEDMKEKRGKTK